MSGKEFLKNSIRIVDSENEENLNNEGRTLSYSTPKIRITNQKLTFDHC